MFDIRKVFYSVGSKKKENCKQTLVIGKEHVLSQLQTPCKTNARKLVDHMASTMHIHSVPRMSGATFGSNCIAKDLKTRLPHHLLGFIDIMHHILSHCKQSVFKSRLNRICGIPDVKKENQLQKFVNLHTPSIKVSMFLKSICRFVLPKNIWGTPENASCFNKLILRLVKARRYDKVYVYDIVNAMDISTMKWLKGKDQRGLLRSFLVWLVEIFVFEAIKNCFYITEHGAFKNKLFYYRIEVWRRVTDLTIQKQITSGVWTRVKSQCERDSPGGSVFSARIIPKTTGTRIIFRKIHDSSRVPKTNADTDKRLLNLLTALWNAHPELRGSGGFGLNMIYAKWTNFVRAVKTMEDKSVYFVKVDIKNCFDSIPREKLLNVIEDCLKQFYDASGLLTSLRNSLEKIYIRVVGECFIKLKGIPQGWKLSSMLCNLLYGHFEHSELPKLMTKLSRGSKHCHLLMRIIDDFMLATTDIDEAVQFVRDMHGGFPGYGIEVNPAKTITNFQIPVYTDIKHRSHISVIGIDEAFPWFGHLFLPANNLTCKSSFIGYGVGIELARYGDSGSIRDSISKNGHPNNANARAERGIIKSIRRRLSPLCLHHDINSLSRLHRNAFEISYLISLQWLSHNIAYMSWQWSPILSLKRILTFHVAKRFRKSFRSEYNMGMEYVIMTAAFKAIGKYGSKLMKDAMKNELTQINASLHKNCVSRTKLRMLKRVSCHSPSALCRLKLS